MSNLDKFSACCHSFRMNIAFDKHQEQFIKHKLKAGGYRNAAEVVREAIRLLEAQEELPSAELEAEILKALHGPPAKPLPTGFFDKLRETARKPKKRAA
jgi:putative addiction module CopG family antidote